MSEIVAGTSPLIEKPEVLGPEQMRPVSISISEQLKARGGNVIQGTKRRPGRPPGSGTKAVSTESSSEDELKKIKEDEARRRAEEAKRRIKQTKVNEYTEKIINEGNEYIMSMLIGSGVPAKMIYREGMAPVQVVNEHYTEFGNRIAVKPMQARAVAAFLADLEGTDSGQKVTSAFAGGGIGLAFKGIVAGAAVFSYARGLYQIQQQLAPMLAAAQAYRQEQDMQKTQQTAQTMGVM